MTNDAIEAFQLFLSQGSVIAENYRDPVFMCIQRRTLLVCLGETVSTQRIASRLAKTELLSGMLELDMNSQSAPVFIL